MLFPPEVLDKLSNDHPAKLLAQRNRVAFDLLEQWYADLYPKGDPAMEGRFRDSRSSFVAALYELLLHRYAQKRGWTARRDFEINGKNPDFYFDEINWMGEVFTIGSSDDERKEDRQIELLCEQLNGLSSEYWLSFYDYELMTAEIPSKKIADWVKGILEKATTSQLEETYEDEGCRIEFMLQKKDKAIPGSNVGIRGLQSLDFEAVKSRTLGRLRQKAKKYDMDAIVFACSGHATPRLDVEMLDECLYGERAVRIVPTGELPQERRVFQGFFSKVVKGKPQNTRISAVVFCQYGVNPDGCWSLNLAVLHNPYARKRLDEAVFAPCKQFVVTAEDGKEVTMAWVSKVAEPFSLC